MTKAVAPLVLVAATLSAGLPGWPEPRSLSARQPTFRAAVDLVEVAVSVRDRDGRFVPDLAQRDFQILEQGRPQTIVAFDHVSIPVAAANSAVPRRLAAPDVASNDRVSEARVFVLVLDSLHVASERSNRLRTSARQFVEQHMAAGDFAAVLSPGAIEAATQDFTSDKARILAAIDRFMGTKLRSATLEAEDEKRRVIDQAFVMHPDRDPSDAERASRATSLADVLAAVARDLDPMKGRRKAVLLFTEGIDYNVFEVAGASQGRGDGSQRYGADVRRSLERAAGALMRTNAVLYTIDPRGVTSPEIERVEAPGQLPPTNDILKPGLEAEFAAAILSQRSLAEPTGGFAAVNSNDFRPAFDRIVADSSEYYVLGYTPSHPPKPGEFREISVRLSRPDARVVARKGYMLPGAVDRVRGEPDPFTDVPLGPATPGRMRPRSPGFSVPQAEAQPRPVSAPAGVPAALAQLLSSSLPQAGLQMRVQAVPFSGDRKAASVEVIVEVLGRSLNFEQKGGRFEERVDLAMITVDGRGRAGNGTSTRIDMRLTPEEFERVSRTGVRWLSRLALAPGRYQIRVAGAARGAAPGAVICEVDVPRFESGHVMASGVSLTSLVSVVMITRGEARHGKLLETPPTLERSFVKGDVAKAGLEVYVPASLGGEVVISARVERTGGLPSLDAGTRKVAGGGQAHAEELVFPLNTAALDPGQYLLRIVVSGGGDKVERVVPFEVVAGR